MKLCRLCNPLSTSVLIVTCIVVRVVCNATIWLSCSATFSTAVASCILALVSIYAIESWSFSTMDCIVLVWYCCCLHCAACWVSHLLSFLSSLYRWVRQTGYVHYIKHLQIQLVPITVVQPLLYHDCGIHFRVCWCIDLTCVYGNCMITVMEPVTLVLTFLMYRLAQSWSNDYRTSSVTANSWSSW